AGTESPSHVGPTVRSVERQSHMLQMALHSSPGSGRGGRWLTGVGSADLESPPVDESTRLARVLGLVLLCVIACRRRARGITRVAVGTALASALMVLIAGPASAHTELEETNPPADAVLRQAPAQVVLRFDEAVTLLPTSIQVTGPDGSRVDTGTA